MKQRNAVRITGQAAASSWKRKKVDAYMHMGC